MISHVADNPSPQISGVTRRLMALVYDAFLLLGISFGYGVVVLLLRKAMGEDTLTAPSDVEGTVILIGLWACYSVFYIWCWRKSGQTLGMKSWRIQLTTVDGGPPSLKQCWLRCIVAPPLLLLGGIGYWWCLFAGDSLADKLTETRVLLLPKSQRLSRPAQQQQAQ